MKKKSLLLLILISSLLLLFSTTSVKAETTDTPLTDADIAQVFPHKDNTEIIVSYVLEDQKELVLKTTEKDVLDIEALKKELGEDNVLDDSEKNETIVKLDPQKISFKLFVDNQKPFTLSVHKINGEEIFNYDVNDTNQTRDLATATDDEEDESGWVFSEMLKVSEGPILEHSDGSSTRPLLYFGDYNYAIQRMSISDAFGIRGNSRIDSLTTPGTAVLYASKDSRIEDGAKAKENHIYTDHYGDHQENDYDMISVINMGIKEDPRGVEDRSIGSPRSYTSNNLYNYVEKSDGNGVPGVSGPNKIGQSYAMLETPKFYYRTNPKTGFEEQKIVYKQKAFYAYKKGRNNPEITTTIKLSFNKVGRVQTKIAFKNTGKYAFGNFVGLSNHDLSLNKDNQEIRDNRGKAIGNYVKLRALGNQRGMYMQSGDNQVRTSYYLNRENGPAGWAARSSSKSYIATKGFMSFPGLIGIASSSERYYPWKIGKDDHTWSLIGGNKPTKFFNDDIPGYRSPYVAEKLYNAFSDHWDKGDLERKEVGARLGVKENDYTWDSGLTMRTSPRDLLTGQTIKLEYESQIDVKGTTFNPVFELDLHGTSDNPQVISDKKLQDSKGKLPITGTWYDFDSTDVTMYYSIDSEDPEDDQILFNRSQSPNDAFNGKLNDITKVSLPLKGLDPGMHTIRFYMIDKEGHRSQMQEHVLKISKPVTNEPQIDVTSPGATSKNPYKAYGESIDIKGTWSDKDSKKIKSISYQINNHDEKIIRENIPNPTPGKQNNGDIDGLDISCCNNFDKNKIVFKIVDEEGFVGTDSFYFQHVPGGLTLSAPEEIDFGTLAVAPTGGTPVKPTIKEGKIILGDYRQQDAAPISVSLKMDKFYKENEQHHDEGNGDDSLANIDKPDSRKNVRNEPLKESLVHDVYWKDKLINGDDLIIGQSAQKTGPQWEYKTNLTEDVLKNLKIRFRSGENGASSGKYVSHWTWQTVDSVQ